jgi:inosine-uridine nucleoside N-ribohydrolase
MLSPVPPAPAIVLDCDPGHDDAIAIVVADRHADLLGVTTVAGNAPIEATTRNALVMRELLGATFPVHRGAARPLVAEPRHASYVHGESGLDGADLPEPARAPSTAPTQSASSSTRAGPPRARGSWPPARSRTSPWRCAPRPISPAASPGSR